MTMESPCLRRALSPRRGRQATGTIIYRSRLNPKINRNFQVFTPTDFLAAITQHIPDQGTQMVCYYGWYSNKMRDTRCAASAPLLLPLLPRRRGPGRGGPVASRRATSN